MFQKFMMRQLKLPEQTLLIIKQQKKRKILKNKNCLRKNFNKLSISKMGQLTTNHYLIKYYYKIALMTILPSI